MKIGAFLKRWWVLIVVAGILLAVILFHVVGFRLAPGLSIVRVGTLYINDLPPGASIYVDEEYNRRTSGGTARITLLPGSHNVIVSADAAQPWNEIVTVVADTDTNVRPIIVPVKPVQTALSNEDTRSAAALISKTRLPTQFAPLSFAGGCALVSVEANRIVARASTTPLCTPPAYLCTEENCGPTVIFTPVEPIRTVLPYPGRDDTMVISVGTTLFVLEVDPRTPQFFAPLPLANRAATPRAALWKDLGIVVSTGVEVHRIDL